jgi:hypothetical protein
MRFRKAKISRNREVAIHDFEVELTRLLMSLSDQNFASGIQQAIDDDVATLEEAITEEVQAQRDRAMALSIGDENPEAENLESLSGVDGGRKNSSALETTFITSIFNGCKGDNFAGPSALSR